MNTLVKFIGNDVFTDSMVIAEGTGNQHESVVSLIKTHQKSLKKFGNIGYRFEIGKPQRWKANKDLSAQRTTGNIAGYFPG